MLSNKLTFSLASLVLLFAFIAMPVMADPNDPDADLNDTHADRPGDAAHTHPTITIAVKDANNGTDGNGTGAVMGDQVYLDDQGIYWVLEGIDFILEFTSDVPVARDTAAVSNDDIDTELVAHGDRNGATVLGVSLTAASITAVDLTPDDTNDNMVSDTKFTASVQFSPPSTPDDEDPLVTRLIVDLPVGAFNGVGQKAFVASGEQASTAASLAIGVLKTAPEIVPDAVEATVTGTPSLTSAFIATFTFAEAAPASFVESDIDVTGGFVIGGSLESVEITDTSDDAPAAMYTAVIQPSPGATTVTVTIDEDSAAAAAAATNGIITTTAPTTPDPTTDAPTVDLQAASIAASGFHVVVHSPGTGIQNITSYGGLSRDLEDFFLNGGTIALIGPTTATKGDLVISEIMWGTDGGSIQSQWIELYNTTGAAISAADYSLRYLGPGVNAPATAIDVAGNYGPTGFWAPKGQSGRADADVENNLVAVDIISMYRKIDYTKVEKGDHTVTAPKTVRDVQLEGVVDGTAAGNWEASSRPSVNLAGRRVGTPGAKHFDRTPDTATALSQDIIINEIGNGSGDADDWVELLNTTASAINLKNWALSIVTEDADGVATDTNMVVFPDLADDKPDATIIPANGILLLTNTDPTNSGNDLAAGVQVNVQVEDQVKRGVTSLYYVNSGVKIPDTGKTLLVLRNAKDKVGKPDAIIDAGGTLFHAVRNAEKNAVRFNTEVWPLHATAKGHDNAIDGTDTEEFDAGEVYKRGGKNSGLGEKHWAKVGFTGIGYDRTASKEDSNGGTPGYPNDGLKEKVADLLSDAEITISEVMADSGAGRRSLPQWIELYNSSMTQAVNLNEWTLEIQNSNTQDVDSRINATLKLTAMTIAPNQTVLIATSRGLNSGADHFPATRVVNLWTTKAHREALEMTSLGDRVLSGTGFYLKLTDKDKKVVDEAGNLDGDRRTADDPAWELPASSEENRRASLIRVYEDGVALDGTTAAGWVGASDTLLAYTISHTYYGAVDDFGTPGFRGGGPLPVSLSSFRPMRDKATGAVVIRWITQSELDNAGFNILRSETKTGEFKVVNLKGIIAGHGTTSEKHTYEWKDTSAKPNVVYYYQIEDVSLDGKRTTLRTTHLRGNVNAAGKATTTWADLKSQR